jgi:methylenetetrahydrofolate dehydrogenase (NADP+)/methenyltetrahydrofolate cyclohydrolase
LIDPVKDVDCLTDENRGKLEELGEKADIIPPTPLGILKMLDSKKINLSGKEGVMIGKGKLVG